MILRALPNLAALVTMLCYAARVDELQRLQPEPASFAVCMTIFAGVLNWVVVRLCVAVLELRL